jgi:Helix-turn-helix domain
MRCHTNKWPPQETGYASSSARGVLVYRRGTPVSQTVALAEPGLRREEVARLAGVSVDYYTRLKQGCDISAL